DTVPDVADQVDPEAVRASLTSFLDLPVAQRCAVILKDVLGHSLEETAGPMTTTIPAVKAALFRGRTPLPAARVAPPASHAAPARASGGAGGKGSHDAAAGGKSRVAPRDPAADAREREKLRRYVAVFNARDWDGLRALLAEEVRLDLVAKA